jgi:predicted porin
MGTKIMTNNVMSKTIIASAIAAAVTPTIANAEIKTELYGRINNAININDVGDDSTTNLFNVYSRLGAKIESELDNGMTAFGRYEFSTFTETEGSSGSGFLTGGGGIDDTRLGYVGLRGNFGEVKAGQTWSAFYDTVGTHIDPTAISAYFLYSSVVGGPYRVSNNIQYTNDLGPIHLEVDYRLADSKDGNRGGDSNLNTEKLGGQDGIGIGLSFAASDNLTLAVAIDTEEGTAGGDDTDRTGLSARYTMGSSWIAGGWHEVDSGGNSAASQTQVHVGTNFGDGLSAFAGYGSTSFDDDGPEPTAVTAGVAYRMGGGFRIWYELADVSDAVEDGATRGLGDFTMHVLGARLDF